MGWDEWGRGGGGRGGGGGNAAAYPPPAPPPRSHVPLNSNQTPPPPDPPKLLRSGGAAREVHWMGVGGRGGVPKVRSEEKVGGMACGGGKARQDVKDWSPSCDPGQTIQSASRLEGVKSTAVRGRGWEWAGGWWLLSSCNEHQMRSCVRSLNRRPPRAEPPLALHWGSAWELRL